MASTYTNTRTETFTRNICIRNQFRLALMRIRNYSVAQCELYMKLLAKQKIKALEFRAYLDTNDGDRELWAQLTLYVDWRLHNEYLKKGKDSVELNVQWSGALPEIESSIADMVDIVDEYGLKTIMFVHFPDDMSNDELESYSRKLGLGSSSATWKKLKDGGLGLKLLYERQGKELQELTARMEVTDFLGY